MSFLEIFRIYIADQNTLFNWLLPPPEVGGDLVFDHEIPDPLQGRLHRLLGQPDSIQQILFFGKQEIHCCGQIRQKKCIFEDLGLVADQPSVHYGGGEDNRYEAFSLTFSQCPGPHAGC